jgi:hypothetical protein
MTDYRIEDVLLWQTPLPDVKVPQLPPSNNRPNPLVTDEAVYVSLFSPGAVCAIRSVGGIRASSPFQAVNAIATEPDKETPERSCRGYDGRDFPGGADSFRCEAGVRARSTGQFCIILVCKSCNLARGFNRE